MSSFRDVDVLTVQEDGRSGTPDPLLLDQATELQRVMFSQDQDFLVEAKRRQSEGINFPGVVFARQSRVSIGVCIRDLEIIAKEGCPTLSGLCAGANLQPTFRRLLQTSR